MARRVTGCGGQPRLKGLPGSQTSRALPPLDERKRERTRSRHAGKKPKQRYSQILTSSGPRPVMPAGRPLRPQSPQALPRVAPTTALAPPPPQTPEAPKRRPAQATSRPGDQPPIQPARALALGRQADRPDSPESPQLPRPRGQVPPRPASAPQTRTSVSWPQALMVPCHHPCHHRHRRRRRQASPATAPSGARPLPASDEASPRRPEPASAREPGPFSSPSSPFPSPRRSSARLSPPRPLGPVAGRVYKSLTLGDEQKS
jgi:hypothetical protein